MFRPDEENEAGRALRLGLHSLAVPEPAPDFDARVRAALRRPIPWWQSLWTTARPVLVTTACSLVGTLALLQWFTRMPTSLSRLAQPTGIDTVAFERRLERMDLSTASLSGFSILQRPPAPQPNTLRDPHPIAPDRRSQRATSPAA
jgi:hypothetical protein